MPKPPPKGVTILDQQTLQSLIGGIALKSNFIEWKLLDIIEHLKPGEVDENANLRSSTMAALESSFDLLKQLADLAHVPTLFGHTSLKRRINNAIKKRNLYVHGAQANDETGKVWLFSAKTLQPKLVTQKELLETYDQLDKLSGELFLTVTALRTNFPRERLKDLGYSPKIKEKSKKPATGPRTT